MRQARQAFHSGRIPEGVQHYEYILHEMRDRGESRLVVETMLEFGAQLALYGDSEQGATYLDEAEYLAIESGMPTNRGSFAFARGEVLSGQGDHDLARQQHLQAADEFAAAELPLNFLGALSRWALEHDFFDDPGQSAGAHQYVIDAVRRIVTDPKLPRDESMRLHADQLVALHWGRIAEAKLQLGDKVAALAAAHEARDLWAQTGRAVEVARSDVTLGNLYVALDCIDEARSRWQQARNAFAAEGEATVAAEIDAALARLGTPGLDAGPELA